MIVISPKSVYTINTHLCPTGKTGENGPKGGRQSPLYPAEGGEKEVREL